MMLAAGVLWWFAIALMLAATFGTIASERNRQ